MELLVLGVIICWSAIELWRKFSRARTVAAQADIARSKADVVKATAKTLIEVEKLKQDTILNSRLEVEALLRQRMKSIEAAATEHPEEG